MFFLIQGMQFSFEKNTTGECMLIKRNRIGFLISLRMSGRERSN
jgi:hypothetical protein